MSVPTSVAEENVSEPDVRFAVGSIVRARGREWVVQPGSDNTLLVVHPLGGSAQDTAGLLIDREHPEPAAFPFPTADDLGDDHSARLLRDALRIGFRSSAGPFRSIASLAVEPRPYQLVPLLLALRQDVTRLLIADEVGVGKTIEAGLVAAELLATGAASGLSVLCPPSLAEQWRAELADKFGIHAVVVQPGTVRRLERQGELAYGESLFERYRYTIVSTDFIKSENRRYEFLRSAPDLIIVDEAHTCVTADGGDVSGRRSSQTQRYRLLLDLAAEVQRHLILVTATPHSGVDAAFRNLIGLLNPELATVDLSTPAGRELLARHMVQRRRGNLRDWLADTRFPSDRIISERPYRLRPAYRQLLEDVLTYVHGQVIDPSGNVVQQRVRWWSALALLRAMASSPQAAAATLATRSRVAAAATETVQFVDALGAADALDLPEDAPTEGIDATPGAMVDNVLSGLRDRALALTAKDDAKLAAVTTAVKELLDLGQHPVVFCRFIATAHAVAEHLRAQLRNTAVEVVTGDLAPEDRVARVTRLVQAADGGRKVLVATDCLSEGVNLQADFQAVVHYDLAWNPTRHEQREGRVDRFGQIAENVRAVTIYGADNGIDGIVMKVLLRKHRAIRLALGVDVPVPSQAEQVIANLVEGLIRRSDNPNQLELDLEGERQSDEFEGVWRSTAASETRITAQYAQRAMDPDEVMTQVKAAQRAIGGPSDVTAFVRTALTSAGAPPTEEPSRLVVETAALRPLFRDALGASGDAFPLYRDVPAPMGAAVLTRTDPHVSALARSVLESALDNRLPALDRPARRAGLIVTADVVTPTVAVLVRLRLHLTLPTKGGVIRTLAEDARLLAFTGPPGSPQWLDDEAVEALLAARPGANLPADMARGSLTAVLAALGPLTPHLESAARSAAEELRQSHIQVRRSARRGDDTEAGALAIRGLRVEPQLPVDVLGVYLYRPLEVSP